MGSEGRTRLALAALLGTTIAAYMQVMRPDDYAGPVLLGMAIAGALAVGARRLGLGTPLSALLSALALLTYVGLVFAGDHTAYGLPTPAAVAAIARSIVRAYDFVEIDFAPVPVRPGYVVMLVTGLWGATALGEIATFRWRRPLLASIAPIALFSIAVVVGTGTFVPVLVVLFLAALMTFWAFESLHRLRSWGRWVSTWPGRRDDEPTSIVGVVGRRMAASTIALALASPFVLPALGEGALAWRSGIGGGPGASSGGPGDGTTIDPLVSIASTLTGRSEEELFRVETSASTVPRWHLWTLTEFDGERWKPAPDPTDNPSSEEVDVYQPSGAPVERLEYRVELSKLVGERMPVAFKPSSLKMNELADQADVRVDTVTGDVAFARELEDDLAYDVVSDVPVPTEDVLRKADVGLDAAGDEYVSLPPGAVDERVERLLERWTARAETPFEKLVAIQERLWRFTYNADPGIVETTADGVGINYLTKFLLDTKMGFCQQFATAFAVLSRHLGYPTRVVVGFMPGLRQSTDDGGKAVYVVRGSDAHAWPEVYFRNVGWVPFEPTPRPDAVPEYTQPDVPGDGLAGGGDAASQRNRASQLAERAGAAGGGPGAGDGRDARAREAEWERRFARLLTIVALGVLAFLAGVPALKGWRVRRRYARARDAREAIAAAFEDFEQAAADLATPRSRAETATAYATRVTRAAKLSEDAGRRLASLYDAALYAPSELRDERAREARSLVKQLKDGLWSQASWWSRGTRVFSTRGLASPGRS
ncbi:MAG TPA: DUF3488 and transglutaminase-like domain-containing protein [Actinomycetota bacterium]|nr:DUF3488 and transglutaminase-like domain-containing protein [Actinomycetota bacterium]